MRVSPQFNSSILPTFALHLSMSISAKENPLEFIIGAGWSSVHMSRITNSSTPKADGSALSRDQQVSFDASLSHMRQLESPLRHLLILIHAQIQRLNVAVWWFNHFSHFR